MTSGYLYADYSTRLCVYRCPDNFGPFGTFGDVWRFVLQELLLIS
jgi:hypothetical protein